MKRIIIIFVLIAIANQFFAQESESKQLPISIGYWGNFLYQPGVKVSTQFDIKNWQTEHEGKKENFTKHKSYFISPQLGFFSWPKKNINFLVNVEAGYQRKKSHKNSFSSISFGLGYLMEGQVVSIIYNLNDGSIKEKVREWENYILPTINYGFGKSINSKLDWYSKISIGKKFSFQDFNSFMVLVETGVTVQLGR